MNQNDEVLRMHQNDAVIFAAFATYKLSINRVQSEKLGKTKKNTHFSF